MLRPRSKQPTEWPSEPPPIEAAHSTAKHHSSQSNLRASRHARRNCVLLRSCLSRSSGWRRAVLLTLTLCAFLWIWLCLKRLSKRHVLENKYDQTSPARAIPDHWVRTQARRPQARALLESLKADKPPLVERSFLLKSKILGMLDVSSYEVEDMPLELGLDLDSLPHRQTRQHSWPPFVQRIPDTPSVPSHSRNHAHSHSADHAHTRASHLAHTLNALDHRFCGTSPCQLLLPARIVEQESKAREHLRQLAHLASLLGRTLVLPHAGRARVGSCGHSPLATYYDVREMLDVGDGDRADGGERARAVTMDAFMEWVAARALPPTAQSVSILPKTKRSVHSTETEVQLAIPGVLVRADSTPDPGMKHNNCLSSRAAKLRFGQFPELTISPKGNPPHLASGNRTIDETFGVGVLHALSDSGFLHMARAPSSHSDPGPGSYSALASRSESSPAYYSVSDSFSDKLERNIQLFNTDDSSFASPLRLSTSTPRPDVLVASWELRLPLFDLDALPNPPPVISYSPRLTNLASLLLLSVKRNISSESVSKSASGYDSGSSPGGDVPRAPAQLLVVHWRMETAPAENMLVCAEKLVSKLQQLLPCVAPISSETNTSSQDNQPMPIPAGIVWLATDYPVHPDPPHAAPSGVGHDPDRERDTETEGDVLRSARTSIGSTTMRDSEATDTLFTQAAVHVAAPQSSSGLTSGSGTFKDVSHLHTRALTALRDAFNPDGPLEHLRLTGLAETLQRAGLIVDKLGEGDEGSRDEGRRKLAQLGIDPVLLEDSGVRGILDKLVAMRAGVFVSAAPGCGRVSSFTRQIVEARKAASASPGVESALENVVEHFGLE